MKNNNKKGFTIVELVIVIAVIAILAAVLIPTFSSVIKKAKVNNDIQLVRNLNTALATDTEEHKTMQDALDAAFKFGYDVTKINASATDNEILWDSVNDVFCYLNTEKNALEYIPSSVADDDKLSVGSYLLWKISDTVDEIYSTYYTGSATTINTSKGFDAGKNKGITAIKYENTTGTAQKVVIRTNGGMLEVNGYVDPANNTVGDVIHHYGSAENVNVLKCAMASYHVHGTINGIITIKQGHIAVEETGVTNAIIASSNSTGAIAISNKGTISVINTDEATEEITIKNEGIIDVSVGTATIEGASPTNNYDTAIKLTSETHEITAGGYYDGTGVTISSTGSSGDSRFAITIKTTEKVVIDGVTLTGLRGIQLHHAESAEYNFTLINSKINVQDRGIQVWFDQGEANTGTVLNVINSNFSNTRISDYDTNTSSGTQGIILNGTENAKVNVANSTIQGFGYAIISNYYNGAGGNKKAEINVDNCIFKGRAGLDLISLEESVVNISNTIIRGINTFEGTSESFGVIVLETGSKNNTINLSNCRMEGYRAPVTDYNSEYAFDVRDTGNIINLIGNNTMQEDIYFAGDGSNAPTNYEELMPMNKIIDGNTVNGSFTKAVCVIHVGDFSTTYDWLKK